MPRPSAAQLEAARGKTVPDLVAPDLTVLFVGINPSLWSAAIGHHFGNPANRLWPTLHAAGYTDRRLRPDEGDELLARGYGITNVVARATRTAAEISADELRAGVAPLAATVRRWHPRVVAFLGLSAYRTAYGRPKAAVGLQDETVAGAPVWLLPNPSGLNAHYQLPDLARLYAELRVWAASAPRTVFVPEEKGRRP
ncbi:MAG: G/U mismatch-specific DNA glycosylase [Actinomycetota bacterium]|nr:G/U mismatch-specific DNA glycosylase [Actinomycetota bacterium]